MKKLNKISIYGLILAVSLVLSCRDDDWNRAPDFNDYVGAITKVHINPDHNFFNLIDGISTAYVEFDLAVDGFDRTVVSSVDVILTYTDLSESEVYDPVVVKNVTTLPSTVQVTADEAAEALELESDDFELGDRFQVTFKIHAADGRSFTVALNSDACNQPGQPSFGGCKVAWAVSCPSAIPTGTYNYLVLSGMTTDSEPADPDATGLTGTVTITSAGAGTYNVSDITFGAYEFWYCDAYDYCMKTPGSFSDVCNTLSITDQVTGFSSCCGDEIDGSGTYNSGDGKISLSWENAFGDNLEVELTPQ